MGIINQGNFQRINLGGNHSNKVHPNPLNDKNFKFEEEKLNKKDKEVTEQLEDDEDFGVELKKIKANGKIDFFFKDEDDDPRLSFSNHKTAVGNSKWVEYHKQIQGEFYDVKFDAKSKETLNGLSRCKDDYGVKKLQFFKTLNWRRISYVYPKLNVIKDGISNKDIYQGSLGNCYLLSSLSSICEFPERIERILLQRKRSPKGAYCVALCINGVFKEYYLDDMIPVKPDKTIAFCHNEDEEIWAMLIEKAYAKAYGGYWNTGDGGISANALFDLTGAPSEIVRWETKSQEDDLFEMIESADKKKYIMNCGSKGSGEVEEANGIITGHAYTLVGTHRLDNGDRLFQLRNPWGKGEWNGEYSDKSDVWTEELKEKLGWNDEDDGIFFIKVEDFIQNFRNVAICHYRENYTLSSFPDFNQDSSYTAYQFSISKKGEYYFGLSQPDKNHFKDGHTYGFLSLVVGRVDGDRKEYIGGKGGPKRDNWFMGNLERGKYIAFVATNWDNDNTDEVTFWTYGPEPVNIQRIVKKRNMDKVELKFLDVLKNFVNFDFLIFFLDWAEERNLETLWKEISLE